MKRTLTSTIGGVFMVLGLISAQALCADYLLGKEGKYIWNYR